MLGDVFTMTFWQQGTITGDMTFDFKLPFPVQLVAVSAICATNNAAIRVGTSADDDLYVNATDGAITAGTVTLLDAKGDFVGDQYPHVDAETQFRVTVDHTGSNPTNWCAVLTFTKG